MRILASEEIRVFRIEVFLEHMGPQAALILSLSPS